MYNVQILKYPTGWQVRVYSAPVGFCDNNDEEVELMETLVWNEEIRDWESERYNPEKRPLSLLLGILLIVSLLLPIGNVL